MSYTDPQFDPEDYENLQERSRNVPVRQIKAWESQGKRLAELEAKEAARERAATLTEAGIPAEFAAMFRDDLSVDALKGAFAQFGGAPSGQAATQQSLDGHAAAQAMASGAPNASPTATGGELASMKMAARNRKNAKTEWSDQQNNKVNALLAQEGVDPSLRRLNTSDWKLPSQLIG